MNQSESLEEVQSFGVGFSSSFATQLAILLPVATLGATDYRLGLMAVMLTVIVVLSLIPGLVTLMAHRMSVLAKGLLGASIGAFSLIVLIAVPNLIGAWRLA